MFSGRYHSTTPCAVSFPVSGLELLVVALVVVTDPAASHAGVALLEEVTAAVLDEELVVVDKCCRTLGERFGVADMAVVVEIALQVTVAECAVAGLVAMV